MADSAQGDGAGEAGISRKRSETRHLVKASLIVTALGLVTRITSLLTNSVVGAVFGATRLMDAFRIVQSIPQLFSTWIEMPVRAAIVPLFTRRRQEQGEAAAWEAVSNIINTLAILLVLLASLVFLAAPWIVRAMSTGFAPEVWVEMTRLTRIVIFSIVFSVMAVVLGSLHNIYRQQQVPALGRLANALVVLGTIYYLGRIYGLTGYAFGMLAGSMLTLAIQSVLLWQHRQHYRLIVRPRAPEIRELLIVGLPLFFGLTGTRIDVLVDQNFASWLGEGHLTCLLFATMLAGVATDLIITVSSTVLLPHFAELVAEERFEELRRRLLQGVAGYMALLLPVTVFFLVAARPVIDLYLLRGAFTAEAAALTAVLLPILAFAAPVYAVGQVLAQALISSGDTKTPMKAGFWRLGFKLVVTVSLIMPLGIVALAVASSASSFVRTGILWGKMPARMRPAGTRFLRLLAVLVSSSAVGGVFCALFLRFVPQASGGLLPTAIRLVIASGVLMSLHLGLATLMSPELRLLAARFRKRSRH